MTNANVFRSKFIGMVHEDLKKSSKILKNYEELTTFSIDLQLDNFSSLFENLYETYFYTFEF